MAKKNKIYVTTMYKYGNRDGHSYVTFAGFSKSKAINAGEDETTYSGGKYSPEVMEFVPDEPTTRKCVLALEN